MKMPVNRKVSALVGLITTLLVLSGCQNQAQSAPPVLVQSPTPTEDQLATLIAMQQEATRVPSATPWPTDTPTFTPSPSATLAPTSAATSAPLPTSAPSQTPTPSPTFTLASTPTPIPAAFLASATPYPTNTPHAQPPVLEQITPTAAAGALFDQSGEINDHYWFARPFPRDPTNAIRDYASRNYSFGTNGQGQFETHHGVDIQNPTGTAVLAVASGWVVYAGPDKDVRFGPQNDFYGNVVVIEHDMKAPDGRPLYTLYGHLLRVNVETGQRVELQQKIAQVGSTGVALGPHLHFEVRIGDPYDYNSVYNPDLWLRPWSGYGTLAGRITDATGHRLYNVEITIEPESGPNRTTSSYTDDTVNSDPYYGEHFTYGDLPAGNYQVIVRKQGVLRYKGTVTIEQGKTNWLDIVLN